MIATVADAIRLMTGFAERTGLAPAGEPKRYLWTDAFALCNWLELYRKSGEESYRDLATALISQVHGVLGRHRPDDSRAGWLSGLAEEEGARRPTAGGLRIGKPIPERRSDEPFDMRLEWERDGQYFHYITKWIDALVRASIILDEPRYRLNAAELAKAVFSPFLKLSPTGRPVGLSWKMTIDLSGPLISETNSHDALDGYVTYRFVSEVGRRSPDRQLSGEIDALRKLSTGVDWRTSDPLGIGGLLLDAFRLALLTEKLPSDKLLLEAIVAAVEAGIPQFLKSGTLRDPPAMRLAFRELGLAIGLQTLGALGAALRHSGRLNNSIGTALRRLMSIRELERALVEFWSLPRNQTEPSWLDHRDINEVMLATAILYAQLGTMPFLVPEER
jgi:hypothetical protein